MKKRGPLILVVDDEQAALDGAEMALCAHGFTNVMTCRDSRKVMTLLERHKVGLVLLDLLMPPPGGDQLLPVIMEKNPELPVIVITAVNDVEKAVACMRMGAYDYLVKPVEINRMTTSVRRAVEYLELRGENIELTRQLMTGGLDHPEAFQEIVSAHPALHAIFKYIEAIAGSSQCVLVTGETGVGKEAVVNAVHHLTRLPFFRD